MFAIFASQRSSFTTAPLRPAMSATGQKKRQISSAASSARSVPGSAAGRTVVEGPAHIRGPIAKQTARSSSRGAGRPSSEADLASRMEIGGVPLTPPFPAPPTAHPSPRPMRKGSSASSFSAGGDLAIVPRAASVSGSDMGSSLPASREEDGSTAMMPFGTARQKGSQGNCWFECGQTHGLYNIATAAYPKMVCGFCRSSKKALDSQAKLSPAYKVYLEDLKRNRQHEYKEKVRAGRLVPGGPESANMRSQAIASYAAELEVEASVSDGGDVMWPNRDEHIGYSVTFRGFTRERAAAEWDEKLRNPDIQRRGSADDPRMPLYGIPRTTAAVTRRFARKISMTAGITNDQQLQLANARVQVGHLANPASGHFNDVGGQFFAPGSNGQAPMLPLTGGSSSAAIPSFEEIDKVSLAERQVSGASGRRALKQTPSCVDAEEAAAADPRTVYLACLCSECHTCV